MSYYKIIKEEGEKYAWGFMLIQRQHFNNFVKALIERHGKIRLLEVGAWKCMLYGYIKENFGDQVDYTGVDIVDLPDRNKECNFHVMSGDSLLFSSCSFHGVVFIETLEHIPDYVKALREAYRVLVYDGGVFIQSVICTDHNALLDRTHYHVLHPVTLKRLLEWTGFRDVDFVEGGNFAIWGYKR